MQSASISVMMFAILIVTGPTGTRCSSLLQERSNSGDDDMPQTRQTQRQWSGPSFLGGFPWWEFGPAHDTKVIISVETPRFFQG